MQRAKKKISMTNIFLETGLDFFFARDMAGRIQSVHLQGVSRGVSCALGRVKNVSKRVFKNLLPFFAANLYILMGYLAQKGFQLFFDGGKLT